MTTTPAKKTPAKAAPPKADTNGDASSPEARLALLQAKIDFIDWLRVEEHMRVERLAAALASMLAQQAQPAVQQTIMNQLLG